MRALTHSALLSYSVLVFERVVGELRAVVCRSVAVITGSIERNRAVTCDTERKTAHPLSQHCRLHMTSQNQ